MPARSTRTATRNIAAWPVTVQMLSLVAQTLAEEGITPDELLAGSGLTSQALDDSERYLPYQQMVQLLARALDLSRDPALGIRVGQRQTPSGWGIIGYAINCCATIGEALQLGMRYHRISTNLSRLRLEQQGDTVHWIAEPPLPLGRVLPFAMEEEFVAFQRAGPMLTGRPVPLREAHFAYPPPPYAERYEQALGCPVRFDAVDHRVLLDASYLALPIVQANPLAIASATRLCEQLLAAHPSGDELTVQIRQMLINGHGRFPDEESIAAQLHITARTLRNHLRRGGTSFQRILDDVREQLAREYLRNSAFKVEDIALRLNFSDARSFRRAFRQWTGQAPAAFRQRAVTGTGSSS